MARALAALSYSCKNNSVPLWTAGERLSLSHWLFQVESHRASPLSSDHLQLGGQAFASPTDHAQLHSRHPLDWIDDSGGLLRGNL